MASAATLRTEWEMCESALLFQAVSDEPKRSVDAEALRHALSCNSRCCFSPPVGPLALTTVSTVDSRSGVVREPRRCGIGGRRCSSKPSRRPRKARSAAARRPRSSDEWPTGAQACACACQVRRGALLRAARCDTGREAHGRARRAAEPHWRAARAAARSRAARARDEAHGRVAHRAARGADRSGRRRCHGRLREGTPASLGAALVCVARRAQAARHTSAGHSWDCRSSADIRLRRW